MAGRPARLKPAAPAGRPVAAKLGLKAGQRVWVADPPGRWERLVGPVPELVRVTEGRGDVDLVHAFVRHPAALRRGLPRWRAALRRDGALWISWIKKSSPRWSGLTDVPVRRAGLAAGLVDVKVCAIDADWSALKLVYRLRDRSAGGRPPARVRRRPAA